MTDGQMGEGERLFSGYSGRILIILTVTHFVLMMGDRLLPLLLPVIVEDFEITAFGAGLALSTIRIVRAVANYPSGRLADALTRKTVLIGSFCLPVVGFWMVAIAFNYWMVPIGVAFIGAAVRSFDPASRAVLADLFLEKHAGVRYQRECQRGHRH